MHILLVRHRTEPTPRARTGNDPGDNHVPSLEQHKDGRTYTYFLQYCWSSGYNRFSFLRRCLNDCYRILSVRNMDDKVYGTNSRLTILTGNCAYHVGQTQDRTHAPGVNSNDPGGNQVPVLEQHKDCLLYTSPSPRDRG